MPRHPVRFPLCGSASARNCVNGIVNSPENPSVPAVCLRLPALASPAGESPISPSALTGDKPFRKPGTAFQGNRLYKTSNNAGNAFHLLAISV